MIVMGLLLASGCTAADDSSNADDGPASGRTSDSTAIVSTSGSYDVPTDAMDVGAGTDGTGSTADPPAEDAGAAPDTAPGDSGAAPGDATGVDAFAGDAASGADATGDVGDASSGPLLLGEYPPPSTIGGARPAKVAVPQSYDATKQLPLVLLLGGYDYFSADLDQWIGLSGTLDSQQFVLVLPDGRVDQDGSPFWNATDTCCDYFDTGVDDSGYLAGLIDEATERLAVDPSRVWLIGHSAGGFMAYRLACDIAPRISAIVSIAGSSYLDTSKCEAAAPVGILQVHGSEDAIMPFDGDSEAPGLYDVIDFWGERAGCVYDDWVYDETPLTGLVDGLDVWPGRFTTGCAAPVELWYIDGADHFPDVTSAFSPAVMAWLEAVPPKP